MGRSKALVTFAAILLAGSGFASAQQPCMTPYQSAARNNDLSYVAQAMEITGLATTFNSTALKATIFLPKNEAFAGFLSSLGLQMDQVLNTSAFTPYLGQILEYHVVPNQVIYAADFTQGEVLSTVINETLTVGLNPLTITPTGGKPATVTFTDFIACDAIEHVLDTVLLPKSVVMAYNAAMGQPAVTQTPVLPAVTLPSVTVPTVTTVPPATPVATVPPTVTPAAAAATPVAAAAPDTMPIATPAATPAGTVAPVAIQNPATIAAVAHNASTSANMTAAAAAPEAMGAAAPEVKAAAGPPVIPGPINVGLAGVTPAINVSTAAPTVPYVAVGAAVPVVTPVATPAATPAAAPAATPVATPVAQSPAPVAPVVTPVAQATPAQVVQAIPTQVTTAASPMVSQITSEVDALKQKVEPTKVTVTPVQPVSGEPVSGQPVSGQPVSGQPVSGSAPILATPPPPMVAYLPKKAALLEDLKDKLLPQAAAPQTAISGAPVTVQPKNLTALELPQLDIPVPEKPQVDLPTVPPVPVYQFQLPDIVDDVKQKLAPVVDKIQSILPQASPPPPPAQISGTAISGAPIVPPPPPPTNIDIPLPLKKPLLLPLPLKKKILPLLLVDKLKQKLLPEVNVTQSPPPPMPVSGAPVSGAPVSGGISGQQQVGVPSATPATPLEVPAAAAAAAPVAFMLPALPPMQLPKLPSSGQELSYWKNLPQYSQQENGTLVISFPILSGQANSQNDAISQVVIPNGYTISEGSGYGYTSGTATTASTSTSLVTAQSGPAVVPTMPNTNATVYNASTTCSTVPKTAQAVPDMTDFLAGLQETGLDQQMNNATAMMTVFVPVNAAFDTLAQQLNVTVPMLLSQTSTLSQILEYHVVPGMSLSISNLTNGQMLQTMLPGQSIKVEMSGNSTKLVSSDGTTTASILYPDVRACNAYIQVIDTVLSPMASTNATAVASPAAAPAAAAGGR